ncbi:S-adenosyl-l-methionine hydroxide adenosyltransferase family protein [Globicatella sulfidifaciens]|uniref:S-adenosyl-l-methionine hydroxide adenosyltransferase family protein n=1 Tax=Globicatella sulfidifaciens TaxID=136093 RepID=A0A7X8C3V9_9LACT|nr:S-adenosyl-l-methionine hydroxide adenosyltransferase family protein [Globicatella sulfidifaciens]NLJ18526.1 S-adenosyl-l-methionine hydroxide adenosyltransferase family protein [Globicatella sulfidifaciens]
MNPVFNKHLVFQSDFGVADGAVAAMTGVVVSVDDTLRMHHLTHDIPPYDIYLGSYRLYQTYSYWPAGTIFVSIVDPGVGFSQKSLVVELNTGQFVVTPDNGTISHLKRYVGIKRIFEIDKQQNLLPSTNKSYTFYGRDLYAYTAARLSSGKISLENVGPELAIDDLKLFDIPEPTIKENSIEGHVAIHDERYGSLWTNIPYDTFDQWDASQAKVRIRILKEEQLMYENELPVGQSFHDVNLNQAILYANSLQNVGVALNQNSFSKAFNIGYGFNWKIILEKI